MKEILQAGRLRLAYRNLLSQLTPVIIRRIPLIFTVRRGVSAVNSIVHLFTYTPMNLSVYLFHFVAREFHGMFKEARLAMIESGIATLSRIVGQAQGRATSSPCSSGRGSFALHPQAEIDHLA